MLVRKTLMLVGMAAAAHIGTSKPVSAATLTGVDKISVGFHSCALMLDSTVRCWGLNDLGQLGIGKVTPFEADPQTVLLSGTTTPLSGITQVVTSGTATCALHASSVVYCWGGLGSFDPAVATTNPKAVAIDVFQLTKGQLLGFVSDTWPNYVSASRGVDASGIVWSEPVAVRQADGTKVPLTGILSADRQQYGVRGCAILGDHSVACWGLDDIGLPGGMGGALGAGRLSHVTDWTFDALPVMTTYPAGTLTKLEDVFQISVGYDHTCALVNYDRSAFCWGGNEYGQFGAPIPMTFDTAVHLAGYGFSQISAGTFSTCATLADGRIACWGWNGDGAVGVGGTSEYYASPQILPIGTATMVQTDGIESCAVMSTTGVKCWGANYYGQLGDGTTIDRQTPVDVGGAPPYGKR